MYKPIDVVRDIILTADTSIHVSAVTSIGDNLYQLKTCGNSIATKCLNLFKDGNEYIFDSFYEDGIVVSSSVVPEIGDYTFKSTQFVHGTYSDANTAILKMDDNDIDPNFLTFFVSTPLYESLEYNTISSVFSRMKVKLLLLQQNDRIDWCTDDHYDYAINQMRNYSDSIIQSINNKPAFFGEVEGVDLINVIDIGIYKDKKGAEVRLFDWNYSGVVMSFELPILKSHTCCKSKN